MIKQKLKMVKDSKVEKKDLGEGKTKMEVSKRESTAVKKLLASAALSTAIISWIATAQGLDLYVFDHYWQAAIISAAIQGTLFAFSVNAIPLLKKLKSWKRGALIVLWMSLLGTSSVFSYVYISKVVYSDRLLQEDAERILAQNCLESFFELDDILDIEKKAIEKEIEDYIAKLGGSSHKILLSDESMNLLQDAITNLSEYSNVEIYVPDNIINVLEKLKSGNYSSSDVDTLVKDIKVEIESVESRINENNEQYDNLQNDVNKLNDRLETFTNVNNQQYIDLTKQLVETEANRDLYFKKVEDLTDYKRELNSCINTIELIENTLEKQLHIKTIELRMCMNQEELDPDTIQIAAESVYNVLLTNNVSASDERLVGYRAFRNNIQEYARIMESKEKIEKGVESLYDHSSDSKETLKYWREQLNGMQDITKDISGEYFEQYSKKSSEKVDKKEIVERAAELDRLYLSDLNDFELAWSLLFNPIHIYKIMLIFSVLFAFGMDLFSFGAGMLLYFLKAIEK